MRLSCLIAMFAIVIVASDASAIGRRCKCSSAKSGEVVVQATAVKPTTEAKPATVTVTAQPKCSSGGCVSPTRSRVVPRLFK